MVIVVTSTQEEFASFLMIEWRRDHYGAVFGNKTVYISHGGKCMMMQNNNDHELVITEPVNLQSQHEEVDTLVAFHAKQAPEGNILVRSTDTDVLVILLGLAGRSRRSNIILDYGSGNNRRYIGVSNIAAILNEKQAGMTEALLGMHALTGCDFTSRFFRTGKLKPFQRLVADTSDRHVSALRSLTSDDVDMPGVTSFVCSMYGFPTSDINEARYKAFIRMSGGDEKDPPGYNQEDQLCFSPTMQQNAWQPRQKGTVCFDDVEESRSDGSNWRGKTNRLRMERDQ